MRVERLFRSEVTYEPPGGRDGYGDTTFGNPQTIDVRWRTENRLVRTQQGEEVTSSARISTIEPIEVDGRVTDESGVKRDLIQVRTNRDTRGRISHYVGWLK